MPDVFSAFIESPSGETFTQLRAAIVQMPEYRFDSTELDDLTELFEAAEYSAVAAQLSDLMPNWLLSPRVHDYVSHAARQTGNDELAESEHYMARACLRGLLDSGDGSRERPYLVTHITDEYDVLASLDKAVRDQRFVRDGDGAYDRFLCSDGAEVWFDVTPALLSAS